MTVLEAPSFDIKGTFHHFFFKTVDPAAGYVVRTIAGSIFVLVFIFTS